MARLEDDHWWFRARRDILDRAVDRFVGETKLALTVGVGILREAEMLSKRTRLVAIDRAGIDPRCAEVAFPLQADAAALPFASSAFDAVFLFDVLEHVDEEEKVLGEIRRVLAPGGRLLVTVPAYMFLYGLQDVVSEHKRRYRLRPLTERVKRAGFAVDYATYFNTILFPGIAAVRLLRKAIGEKAPSNGASDFDVRLPGVAESVLEGLFSFERHAIGRATLPFGISILCSARRS
jgi:SAM-dependent methyltransferase